MSITPACFDVTDTTVQDSNYLLKLQRLPLDEKILYSTVKIKQFYLRHKGKIAVSFSGGKDSTVLLHLARTIYPNIKGVFIDTGLEYPEIREYVRSYDNIDWIKPKKTFKQVITEYGYPVIGKQCAHYINGAKRGWRSAEERFKTDGKFGWKRYSYMIDAPFKVSERCCDVLKKRPAHAYEKETGYYMMIGVRASESANRAQEFVNHGDDKQDTKHPQLTPLAIWTDADIDQYIKRYNITLAPPYYMGYDRTGCIFCMFGIMADKDRFLKLKATHPKQWAYCMRPIEGGGPRVKTGIGLYEHPDRLRTEQFRSIHRGRKRTGRRIKWADTWIQQKRSNGGHPTISLSHCTENLILRSTVAPPMVCRF